MHVQEAIRLRKSVRAYDDRPVPEDVLNRILEAAKLAPSAMNYQPWHFVVVADPEKRKALSEGRYAKFLTQSPVVIVGLGDKKSSPKWCTVDTTIALQQLVLAATEEGLGTCWIGSFQESRVMDVLEVPRRFEVVAMIAVGYPGDKKDIQSSPATPKNRKELAKIVSYDTFTE